MTRILEHRHGEDHDTILLIDDGKVIGAWRVGENGDELFSYAHPGDLSQWSTTNPAETNPTAYGVVVRYTSKITISADGVVAVICILRDGHYIDERHSALGGNADASETIYNAIEAAHAEGRKFVEHEGTIYTWSIGDALFSDSESDVAIRESASLPR